MHVVGLENSMSIRILLLDVDGVLVHAHGYWASARQTVAYFAQQMGQTHINGPADDDMRSFEAASITSEWDSSALSVAQLVAQADNLTAETLSAACQQIAASGQRLEPVDYAALAAKVPPHPDFLPSRAAIGTVFPDTPLFRDILNDAHQITSPVMQVFQQIALGAEQYARTYGLRPAIESESLLATLDQPALNAHNRDRILTDETISPVIYTARPCLPPRFINDWHGYPPEAEIAQKLVGLEALPLVGYGTVQWLARHVGQSPERFVKPSHVQALSAIYTALYGNDTPEPLENAAREVVPGDLPDIHVIVFEDSSGGIRGVRAAVEILRRHHPVEITAVGIADSPIKAAPLTEVADVIADNINTALEKVVFNTTGRG